MTKTTIYLDEKWLRDLKRLSNSAGGAGVAELIRQAVAEFLTKKKNKITVSYLAKALAKPPRKSSGFGTDPVAYQKRVRSEWDR